MSIVPPAPAPGTTGAGAVVRPLPDRDVVDEHHLRRSRLSAALLRGTASERPGPGAPFVVVALVSTTLALGGTAVVGTVNRHLPAASAPAPAAASVSPAASPPAEAPTAASLVTGHPYGPELDQSAPQAAP